MKHYKVVAPDRPTDNNRPAPDEIETALNKMAREGWKLISVVDIPYSGSGFANTSQLYMFLEKE